VQKLSPDSIRPFIARLVFKEIKGDGITKHRQKEVKLNGTLISPNTSILITFLSLGAVVLLLTTSKTLRMGILTFLLILILLSTTKTHVGSWNDQSRMALIESLVEQKSFIIDDSVYFRTGDKMFVNGHFYSDKPPMLQVIGAGIYYFLRMQGIELGGRFDRAYYWLTLLTIGAGWLVCTITFYLSLHLTNIKEKYGFLLTIALALGTLFYPWSLVFNAHSIAASLLFIGFYFLLKARQLENKKLHLLGAGFLISLAGTIDYAVTVYYIGFLIYLLTEKKSRRQAIYFILPLLITAVPALKLNHMITNDFIPITLHKEFWLYPGSPWGDGEALCGMKFNKGVFLIRYAFHALIGHSGLFSYNPVLLLAFFCLCKEAVRKNAFYKEARVVVVASVLLLMYYLLMTSDYSGLSYSIRWFVVLIPIVFFFMYNFFSQTNLKKEILFSVLLIISAGNSILGALNPWSCGWRREGPGCSQSRQISNWDHFRRFQNLIHKKIPGKKQSPCSACRTEGIQNQTTTLGENKTVSRMS